MKVDLLVAKDQRAAATAERDGLHAHHTLIEGDRRFDICDGQDEVVEATIARVRLAPTTRPSSHAETELS